MSARPRSGDLIADTAVEQIDDLSYRAHVHDGYDVGGVPNGGYLMAICARAQAAAVDRPDPVDCTAHFHHRPRAGDAEVHVEPLRTGGRHCFATARLLQDGTEVMRATATLTDLSSADGLTLNQLPILRLPPPEEWSEPSEEFLKVSPPIMGALDTRFDPDGLGWTRGSPSGRGETTAWSRPHEGGWDTCALLFMADALYPPVFDLGERSGWVPTLSMATQIRCRPASEWLAVRFATRAVTGGYLEEDGEIWDADGNLVALSRQLALAPRPRG